MVFLLLLGTSCIRGCTDVVMGLIGAVIDVVVFFGFWFLKLMFLYLFE